MQWDSESHTNSLIPFFVKGNNKAIRSFMKAANERDQVRKNYLDNTEIFSVIVPLLEKSNSTSKISEK